MRTLLPYLIRYKHYKWMLTISIILSIITMFSGISMLTLSAWFLSSSAVVGFSGLYSFNYMLPAVGVRGTAIIRTAGRYFERLISHDVTFHILQHLRVFIFRRLIPLFPSRLVHFRYGDLLNRIIADVDTLDHFYLRVISPLVSVFIVIVVVTMVLSILDAVLSFILCGMLLLVLLFLPLFFYRIGKITGEKFIHLRGEYRQQLIVWLQSQAELTVFGANQRYRAQMNNTELNWYAVQRKQSELIARSQALMTLISGIAIIFMLWISSSSVGNDQKPEALISLFAFCTLASFEMLIPVANAFQYLGQVIASASRISQLTSQSPEILFLKNHKQPPTHVALCLQNITFFYDGQIQPTLSNLTLNIQSGEHIAILGRTGCGKSTLLQLLVRAWDPHKGLISINEVPLSDFSEQTLRKTVSMVTQRVHLFSATLRDNLLLASPNASDVQLNITLKQVGLDNLLEGEGLDSFLGEGGRQLSGGELRRLAIARSLLHDTPLVLLDEPTEGLDTASENQMLNLIRKTMRDKTILMVTHCLRDLSNFDQIIIIDNGQIIEQGTHKELLEKRTRYYQLQKYL